MSDKTLRYMIASVIIMLLIFQVGTLISALFGMTWGVASALLVMVISFFSVRLARAGAQHAFWFFLPTMLFTVFPIAYKVRKALSTEVSWLDRLLQLGPFLLGFAAPILLLSLVYYELRKRTLAD